MADAKTSAIFYKFIFMEEKYNESTHNRPEGDRVINAPFVVSDLGAHIKQITEEDAYFNSDRNAITLFKAHGVSVVLTALRNGAEMGTPEPTGKVGIIQVLSGSLDVEIESETSTVAVQQIISFHTHLGYHIVATEDTIFLLTFCDK